MVDVQFLQINITSSVSMSSSEESRYCGDCAYQYNSVTWRSRVQQIAASPAVMWVRNVVS